MPAPTFGTVGTYLEGTAGTADVPVPAGVAAGDIIVIPLFVNGTTTVTALPSGFADAPGSPVVNVSGTSHRLHVAWKRATGADAGVYSFTLSVSDFRSSGALRYTGAVASGSPWDVTATGNSLDVPATTTPAVSVTTTGPNRMLVFAGTNWSGGAWTPPTGFTERIDSGAIHIFTADDVVQVVAGSSGTVQATCVSSARSVAWLGAMLGLPDVYTKSGGAVSAGAGVGSKTVTSATVYTKSGGAVSAGAAVGPKVVTHATVYVKSGGAVSAGAGVGSKVVTHALVVVKTGGAVATCAGVGSLGGTQLRGWPPYVAGTYSAPLFLVAAPVIEPLIVVTAP